MKGILAIIFTALITMLILGAFMFGLIVLTGGWAWPAV